MTINGLSYDVATRRYVEWPEREADREGQLMAQAPTPNNTLSLLNNGHWHLNNVNGPLAVVLADGTVIGVGRFWDTYKRLSEDGKCDSPGGAEYRRVLMEWIEDSADNMEEFIIRRANAVPFDYKPTSKITSLDDLSTQYANSLFRLAHDKSIDVSGYYDDELGVKLSIHSVMVDHPRLRKAVEDELESTASWFVRDSLKVGITRFGYEDQLVEEIVESLFDYIQTQEILPDED